MTNPVKQVIVIRKDLKMRRGKEIAQGAHASMEWLRQSFRVHYDRCDQCERDDRLAFSMQDQESTWLEGDHRKITLQVDSEAELDAVFAAAQAAGLAVYMITDKGLTEFNGVPTKTCLAIGPDYDTKIDPITKHLKLY